MNAHLPLIATQVESGTVILSILVSAFTCLFALQVETRRRK